MCTPAVIMNRKETSVSLSAMVLEVDLFALYTKDKKGKTINNRKSLQSYLHEYMTFIMRQSKTIALHFCSFSLSLER